MEGPAGRLGEDRSREDALECISPRWSSDGEFLIEVTNERTVNGVES